MFTEYIVRWDLIPDGAPIRTHSRHLHHGNVLDFGVRGWRAIDPKGLYGERGFDHANIFCNPDRDSACVTGRFERRLNRGVKEASLERRRLLQWILAWSGLSAAWIIETGERPEVDFEVAEFAMAALSTEKTG